jgi:cytochrome c
MSTKRSHIVAKLSVGVLAVACSALPFSASAADPAAGQLVFKANCAVCHTVVPGKALVGPSLFGVVGRHSGQEPGFHYSAANRAADLTWDAATLDKYIASPQTVVHGTIMAFPGLPDAAKRADLIAYLATLK